MSNPYNLVWKDEDGAVAAELAKQILTLRKESMSNRIRILSIMTKSAESRELALVLISDDPSKLNLVQHVPTDLLYALGCLNMIRARSVQDGQLQKEKGEESEAVKVVVDRQLSELRQQLDQSVKSQLHLQKKMDGLTEALVVIGEKAAEQHRETSGSLKGLLMLVNSIGDKVRDWTPNFTQIGDAIRFVAFDLKSFIKQTGGTPASDAIASTRFVGGRV